MITIRSAEDRDLERVRAFYRASAYAGEVAAADRVVMAEEGNCIVGLVRLVRESGVVVLRGMRVAPDQQRQGIGARMLATVDQVLRTEACYCIAYQHLLAFYGRIGFQELGPAAAPPFLAQRLNDYRARRAERFCLLFRPGRQDAPAV